METGPGPDAGTRPPPSPISGEPDHTEGSDVWTDRELNGYVTKWAEILNLRHWDIKIRWARNFEGMEDANGHCRWVLQKLAAVIRIQARVDNDPDIPWEHDVERTVVHELLHLHFAPLEEDHWKQGSMKNCELEQTINLVTDALIHLDRR